LVASIQSSFWNLEIVLVKIPSELAQVVIISILET